MPMAIFPAMSGKSTKSKINPQESLAKDKSSLQNSYDIGSSTIPTS